MTSSELSTADVTVPTVELLFGTKPRLLKAAINVAIVAASSRQRRCDPQASC